MTPAEILDHIDRTPITPEQVSEMLTLLAQLDERLKEERRHQARMLPELLEWRATI